MAVLTFRETLEPGQHPVYVAEPGHHIMGGHAVPTPGGGYEVVVQVAQGRSSSERVDMRRFS